MDVVARICELPLQVKTRENISVFQLVEESGHRAASGDLTVNSVATYIRENPDLIEAWFSYSKDKRASSGWYVSQKSSDSFEVGFYPKGERISFADRTEACAEYIVREVGSISG